MSLILMALGLVLVVEGLAFALAPSRIEEALRLMAALTPEQRRILGLTALALGALLLAVARHLRG